MNIGFRCELHDLTLFSITVDALVRHEGIESDTKCKSATLSLPCLIGKNYLNLKPLGHTGKNMFGVVLWSDQQDQKAVIWCEDHGDLAFYRRADQSGFVSFDAGDWVEFDLTMERHLRFAHNPKLVEECIFPDLTEAMETSMATEIRSPVHDNPSPETARIIPFSLGQTKRGAQPFQAAKNSA
ncbi:hypothetical protein QO034_14340 [Sedimentitalea sp. JM2-8]|uniref:Uncharacterized protein n=1 Tax=Sedimentitalea xiamensis TaxID=3050037 RepID=A0ABT7FGP4_9RHOB|nr:hypothetical protein [Sedimentitalea xiamensis]MDK3074287.1 hypothetical protein [Sedimentitalea xiamensis]